MIAMVTTVFAIQSAVSLRSRGGQRASSSPSSPARCPAPAGRCSGSLIPVVGSAVLLLVGGGLLGAGYGSMRR